MHHDRHTLGDGECNEPWSMASAASLIEYTHPCSLSRGMAYAASACMGHERAWFAPVSARDEDPESGTPTRGGGILSRRKEGGDPYTPISMYYKKTKHHFCLYYKKSKLGPDPRKMKIGPFMSKKNNFAST